MGNLSPPRASVRRTLYLDREADHLLSLIASQFHVSRSDVARMVIVAEAKRLGIESEGKPVEPAETSN